METTRGGLSSSQVCNLTGLSYRQLHYLVDNGVITPAERGHGSGRPHRWAPDQVRQLRLAAVLMAHGAEQPTVRPAMAEAADLSPEAWTARVLVRIDGHITTLLGADTNGWLVDLAACSDPADWLAAA